MLDHRIKKLERHFQLMSVYATVLTAGFAIIGLSAFRDPIVGGVLRAQGLIIEDAKGRERILIGAPIPFARHRVRTDFEKVGKLWAGRDANPEHYLASYKGYRHSMHGMLVLDELGFDRLAIGDSTPDPRIGKRIGSGPGLEINDGQGKERSGYGLLTVGGKDRVVLGLDSKNDTEGLTLVIDDVGRVGVRVTTEGQTATLGTVIDPGTKPPWVNFGLVIREGQNAKHRLTTQP